MRQQFYRFAHQALRDAVLRDPSAWWAAAETQGFAMLQQAWAAAGQGLGPEDTGDGSSMQIGPVASLPGIAAMVITLPPPEAPAECYFIALVRGPGQPPRYFVAERGFDADGGAVRAFWAEWRQGPDGSLMRIRGQDLPTISREALVAAAAEELKGAPAAPPGQWAGAAPPGQWPGAAPPRKKSRTGLFVGCGCASVAGFVLLVGGYLLYQEEGRGLHVPDSPVASVPLDSGGPFALRFKWDGTGYAFNNVWLVIDDGTRSGGDFKIKSTLDCSKSGSPGAITTSLSSSNVHDLESKGGDSFSAWIYLGDEYTHASSRDIECTGTIQPISGQWTKARVVVTQRQRVSDFIAR